MDSEAQMPEGGLTKPKQYDWKDSNLALIGSDLDKATRVQAAEHEMAWKGAGEQVGLQVWRIVKFKVEHWLKDDYGKFFNGDSYIVLNTYKYTTPDKKQSEELRHDVHFWIGKYSTQDEYGTAAYKTVELDDYLMRPCIQHREVQGFESEMFLSYFKAITYLEGGADSGFRKVLPKQYKPRLLHFHGDQTYVKVVEIPRNKDLLDTSDVYILDLGLMLYQWNGKTSNKDERYRAMQYILELREDRGGKCVSSVIEEEGTEKGHEFYCYLDETETVEQESQKYTAKDKTKELYRLSDATGSIQFSLERKGTITVKDFDRNDVFVLDVKTELFVWIGNGTSDVERQNAMVFAHKYLQGSDHPLLPVSCISQKAMGSAASFQAAMD